MRVCSLLPSRLTMPRAHRHMNREATTSIIMIMAVITSTGFDMPQPSTCSSTSVISDEMA